mgnify:CR=1 FL=1
MALFKKVEEVKSALKVLVFGSTGVGKTLFALSFPDIVAIDSEAGMTHYRNKYKSLKYILETTSAVDVEEALDEIEDMDDIKTFVLDSETKIYENMQHSALALAEKRARKKGQDVEDSNISQREWGKIRLLNKKMQSSKTMLSSKGVNIVSVAQEKELKEKKGENWVVVGYASDTAKGFEYDYDIVVRLYTQETKDGTKYFGKVIKDRTQTYKKNDVIENPSFNNWKHIYDNTITKKEEIIDFKKDIATDEAEFDIPTAEESVKELLPLMKAVEKENQPKLKDEIDRLGIDIKNLKSSSAEVLNELILFIKKL